MKGCRLAVEALTLARGQRVLLRELSFDVNSGEMLLLTGANGSGKSSLLRALIGLTPLQAGRFIWNGPDEAPGEVTPAELRSVCLAQGHAAGVKSELTAIENLRLAAALDHPPGIASTAAHGTGLTPDPILEQALARVGLARHRNIETRRLSQGQKQRLQLARFALASLGPHRPLWLMDEPSAALDAQGSALLQDLLGEHLARSGAAIVATHLALQSPAGQTRRLRLGEETKALMEPAWTP